MAGYFVILTDDIQEDFVKFFLAHKREVIEDVLMGSFWATIRRRQIVLLFLIVFLFI